MTDTSSLITDLQSLVPNGQVFVSAADMARYLDEPRKRYHTPARAVVRPGSVAEVKAVLAYAHANDVKIVPQGGNTGLVGGQVPHSGEEIILSLEKLRGVREVNAAAGYMVIEAGFTLQEAHGIADDAGMMLPLWIGSQGSAHIGGILATNAGGAQVLAYGNARDLCLGVEAVLADGRLYAGLNALRKNNTGYDLKDLLVGAEGTLGIITAAVLKLLPKPAAFETALLGVASPKEALDLYGLMRARAGSTLTAFELIPAIGFDLQLKQGLLSRDPRAGSSPWYVLTELSLPAGTEPGVMEAILADGFETGLVGEDSVLAQTETQRHEFWTMREHMSECQAREGASIKHDVSVPLAAVPELIERGIAAARQVVPDLRPVPFGHMGDGNIHFDFVRPEDMDDASYKASWDAIHKGVYDLVLALGGSISAEHGIGQTKAALLAQVKDPVALEMMRAIKRALDPKGILNPGKVLK